jgi:hypothetical protein
VPKVAPGIIPRRALLEPWVDALKGELLLRTGKASEGRTLLMEVQGKLRGIPGPDAWTQTLFHLEGMARSAREAGDWVLAEYTAKQMIDHDPAYGGSHLALALVLRHQGDLDGSDRELDAARRSWRDADPDLPELASIASLRKPKSLGR